MLAAACLLSSSSEHEDGVPADMQLHGGGRPGVRLRADYGGVASN
jgi:hypothetical protein